MTTRAFGREQLLTALAAGADRPLFSPDAWETRLGENEVGAAFLAQVRAEWQPATPPDAVCAEIMDQSRAHISSWHPGWPHLWAHVLRVTGNALHIVADTDIDPAFAFLVGMLHDIGKLDEQKTGVDHELIGALLAGKLLHAHNARFGPAEIERISNAITRRTIHTDPLTDVMYDADKLDKIGATGILRRVSTNRNGRGATVALTTVALDLDDFPLMHFPKSRALAENKLAFTSSFIREWLTSVRTTPDS